MAHVHKALHRHHARNPDIWHDFVSAISSPFQDNNDDDPKNPPDPPQAPRNEPNPGPKTITSVVYSTMSPTFKGPIGGYVTPTPGAKGDNSPSPSSTKTPAPKSTAKSSADDNDNETTSKSSSHNAKSTNSNKAISSVPSTSVTGPLIVAEQTGPPSVTPTSNVDSISQGGSSSSGMTTGAKAGLAIGIVAGIGAILFLILFWIRQKRHAAARERLDDEKADEKAAAGPFGTAAMSGTTQNASRAPRLSLTPMAQADKNGPRQVLQAVPSPRAPIGEPRAAPSPKAGSGWDRPMTGNSQSRDNPFGNHAEAVDPINAAGPATVQDVTAAGAVMTGAAVGAAAGAKPGLVRGASKRGNGPQPFDFTRDNPNIKGAPSPTGTDYSMSESQGTPVMTNGAAAIAAAGGPQNSSVHRVQLDFKPSMEDELEIRAGQLIRLLHEYDDGWALCIRLDRSQQGVCPRTCLSTRPVKPRPQPGPNPNNLPRGAPPPGMRVPGFQQQGRPMSPAMGPGPRPQSPAGGPGRPMTPQGRPVTPNGNGPRGPPGQGRPMSPAMNMGPRPQSPAGGRPMTPNGRPMTPNGRPMTPNGRNSPAPQGNERRITPPGPSRMNPSPQQPQFDQGFQQGPRGPLSNQGPQGPVGRKPVPGQAM